MRSLIFGYSKFIFFMMIMTLMSCNHSSGIFSNNEDPQAIAIITEDVANKIIAHYMEKGEPLPSSILGSEGLRIAASQYSDPSHLEKLQTIYLHFFSMDNGNNIVILACDPSTSEKIYEDTTGTTKIDLPAWQTSEHELCERTIGID